MCSHLHRKEMLSHNWQINEDKTPFFIKYANNWMFNGIPKDQRTSLMSQTWELVKNNYTLDDTEFLLNSVNHKDTFKNATSRKFKKDLIEFFSDDKYKDLVVFLKKFMRMIGLKKMLIELKRNVQVVIMLKLQLWTL